ncbi:hypothetical protein [Pseudomonas sp. MYb118]|uniref:hypothetical protein n=1 Tax=Pseudomonas sp. MYb118 TaxID=1848720 RepID=UPI0034CF0BD2
MSDSFFSQGKIGQLKNTRADFAVYVLLVERLQKFGVNPHVTFLNSIDVSSDQVTAATSLFDEALAWVEKEAVPDYARNTMLISRARYSREPKDLIDGLTVIVFESIVSDIVKALTAEPSINTLKRNIKSVTVEDVRVALRDVTSVNIDEVYLTTSGMSGGELIAVESKSIVEDIYSSFQHNEIPYYYGEGGVYTVRGTLEEQYRHPQLSKSDISQMVVAIIPVFLV